MTGTPWKAMFASSSKHLLLPCSLQQEELRVKVVVRRGRRAGGEGGGGEGGGGEGGGGEGRAARALTG